MVVGVFVSFTCRSYHPCRGSAHSRGHSIRVAEQAVAAQPFRSGAGGDVLGVALGGLHTVPVLLQCQRNEGRGVGFGRCVFVVIVLQQLFCIREVLATMPSDEFNKSQNQRAT